RTEEEGDQREHGASLSGTSDAAGFPEFTTRPRAAGAGRSSRSERGGLSPSLRFALRLQLLHPAPDQLSLERAQVVDEELALQVVHLVLDADGEQRAGGFLLLPLAVAVGVLHHDVPEPGDFLVLVGDGEAALGIGELALA